MLAASFTTWLNAWKMKLAVATSTIGRRPLIAAPMPVPTYPTSAIGGSQTRSPKRLRISTVSVRCFVSPKKYWPMSITRGSPSSASVRPRAIAWA